MFVKCSWTVPQMFPRCFRNDLKMFPNCQNVLTKDKLSSHNTLSLTEMFSKCCRNVFKCSFLQNWKKATQRLALAAKASDNFSIFSRIFVIKVIRREWKLLAGKPKEIKMLSAAASWYKNELIRNHLSSSHRVLEKVTFCRCRSSLCFLFPLTIDVSQWQRRWKCVWNAAWFRITVNRVVPVTFHGLLSSSFQIHRPEGGM